MFPNRPIIISLLAIGWLVSACSAQPGLPVTPTKIITTRSGALTPLVLPTQTRTALPSPATTPTPLPSPTPTPRTHAVQKGEDMGGIAYRYRVSVQELMAANPQVNPNLMSVGTVLTIPNSKTPEPTSIASKNNEPSTPTPIPLEVGLINCLPSQEGGIWCFLPLKNQQSLASEGVSAIFRGAGKDGKMLSPLAAFPLLDVLPPGVSLPAAGYFSPRMLEGLTPPYQFSGEVSSALPSAEDGRYLSTKIGSQTVLISPDGLSAQIRLEVEISQPDSTAQRLWIAAIAYNAQNQIVGIRRWESEPGQTYKTGTLYPIETSVYSLSEEIKRVELVAEARP